MWIQIGLSHYCIHTCMSVLEMYVVDHITQGLIQGFQRGCTIRDIHA